MTNTPTLYTIGHSNKPLPALIQLALTANIERLIDVRSKPVSRFNPQFNRVSFEKNLPPELAYEYRGRNLGGLDDNSGWDEAIAELAERARNGERNAVMCSEGDFHKCHRFTQLQPAFLAAGIRVRHVLWNGDVVDVDPSASGGSSGISTIDTLF